MFFYASRASEAQNTISQAKSATGRQSSRRRRTGGSERASETCLPIREDSSVVPRQRRLNQRTHTLFVDFLLRRRLQDSERHRQATGRAPLFSTAHTRSRYSQRAGQTNAAPLHLVVEVVEGERSVAHHCLSCLRDACHRIMLLARAYRAAGTEHIQSATLPSDRSDRCVWLRLDACLAPARTAMRRGGAHGRRPGPPWPARLTHAWTARTGTTALTRAARSLLVCGLTRTATRTLVWSLSAMAARQPGAPTQYACSAAPAGTARWARLHTPDPPASGPDVLATAVACGVFAHVSTSTGARAGGGGRAGDATRARWPPTGCAYAPAALRRMAHLPMTLKAPS